MTVDDNTTPHVFPLNPPALADGARPGNMSPPTRDDTTRYLCAAAHMDPDYANRAIREFLVEDTRPVAPSAGVDAAEVLAEAVAARTRRKLRDIALIVLLVGVPFLVSVELLGIWIVLAISLSVPAMISASGRAGQSPKSAIYVVGGVVAIGLVAVLWPQLEGLLSSSGTSPFDGSSDYGYSPAESSSTGTTIGAVLIVAAMLAVLLADRFVVWKHLKERFWPNRLSSAVALPRERPVFQFSPDRFITQLRRYESPRPTIAEPQPGEPPSTVPGGPVQLIVHRDFVPFVGAGLPEEPWSIAVPLEKLPDAKPTMELTTDSLYAGIRDEINSLRGASTLTPGRRLGDLAISEVVLVSADELIDHLADPSAADFLEEPGVAPFTMISRDRAQSIKVEPLEWARYYQHYQVETWDRDLVVSVFVHVAVGRGALYVEWTPCVLRPLKRRYRKIDQMSRSPLRPAGHAMLDLVRLPVSIFDRIRHTLSFIRPVPQDEGAISPEMYGVSTSLREMASDDVVHNYFQLCDIDRYLKMMESRLILAVSRMMRAAGYSPASFDERAATVVNNNVQIGGSVGGNVVAGIGNKA
jgi:hypothetical protein